MSREYGLGWSFSKGILDGENISALPVKGRLELACMRQIGWEVLETLRLRAPEFFSGSANSFSVAP
jgi:hypothetical protein